MYINIIINIIVNIIIGLNCGILLAYLFINNKIIYHGPNSNIIRKKIHLYNNKYYKYEPVICICPI